MTQNVSRWSILGKFINKQEFLHFSFYLRTQIHHDILLQFWYRHAILYYKTYRPFILDQTTLIQLGYVYLVRLILTRFIINLITSINTTSTYLIQKPDNNIKVRNARLEYMPSTFSWYQTQYSFFFEVRGVVWRHKAYFTRTTRRIIWGIKWCVLVDTFLSKFYQ